MKTVVKTVTPAMAQKFLDRNPRNRRLNKKRVAQYASDMRQGTFILTHQGLAFDENGDLVDGQHRLAAVIASGVSIPFMVTTGMALQVNGSNGHAHTKIDVMDVFDGGQPRYMGQRLQLAHGIPNANVVAAIVQVIKTICAPGSSGDAASTAQVLAIRELYADEIDRVMARAWSGPDRRAAVLGSMVLFAAAFPQSEEQFSNGLISMEGLTKKSPIATLRRWFLNQSTGGQSTAGTVARIKTIRVVTNAAMKFHEGATLEKLYETEDGLNKIRAAQKDRVRKVAALFGA